MSKVRLIVLSCLAVLVVSGVASASASAAHQFLINGNPITSTLPVLGEGKLFTLKAGTKEITCHKVIGVGTVSPGGLDEATDLHFLECLTNQAGCDPHTAGAPNGLILVQNIPTALTLRAGVLADEYKSNATTKEFVTIEFTALAGGSCSEFPTTKVKGQVAGEVLNATEEINFPQPELTGNTLEAFGKAASLIGRNTQMLTNGGSLTAS